MSIADTRRNYFTSGLQSAGVTVDPKWTNSDLEYQFYKTFSGVASGSVSDLRRAFLLKANKISSAPKSNEDLENDLFGTVPNAQFTKTVRVNSCLNPKLELSASGWTFVNASGTATVNRVASTIPGFNWMQQLTYAGASDRIEITNALFTVASGLQYTSKLSLTDTAANNYIMEVWNSTGGTQLGATASLVATGAVETPSVTVTSIDTGLFFKLRNQTAGAGTMNATGVIVEMGATVGAYFDGDSAGCYWEGTAHASRSIKVL